MPNQITNTNEVNSKIDNRPKISTHRYEVLTKERSDILTLANNQALLLYEYYLRMASIPDAPMEDVDASEYFGWSASKVTRARLALEKLGYFKKIIYKSSAGKKTITYYVSKDAVAKA